MLSTQEEWWDGVSSLIEEINSDFALFAEEEGDDWFDNTSPVSLSAVV